MFTLNDFCVSSHEADTFGAWLSIPKGMQKKYEEKFGIKDEGMNAVWCEYHIDDNTYHYCFLPSNTSDTFDVTEDFCHLNNLLFLRYRKSICIGRYSRIDLVKYDDGSSAYLITGNDIKENGFEVDMASDCWFNTGYEVVERKTVKEISELQDIIDFAQEHGIDLSKNYKDTHLLVGGEKDCAIFSNLEYNWI